MTPPESCKVYTPPELARAMARVLPTAPNTHWLEPCAGSGVFLQALSESGVPRERIRAMDLDKDECPADQLARTIRPTDFLAWARNTDERFDRVIANPPYFPINRLESSLRESAILQETPDGRRVQLGSNYWCAFLCASLRLLKPGACISFVLPSSWDYADYAAPLRQILPNLFQSVVVHRSRKPLFDSVQEGSVVLVARGFGQGSGRLIRCEHEDRRQLLDGLARSERVCGQETSTGRQSKWVGGPKNHVRFDEIMELRLGGVTGDSRYFLLTEMERQERELPVASLRPVLSRARHLTESTITRKGWEQLRDAGERVWLFSPSPHMCSHPAVRAYLQLSQEHGGCKRSGYKISRREPWYRTPLPAKCDGFMSGMSKSGPRIAFKGMRGLTATNTLYVLRFRDNIPDDERYSWALSLITSAVREQLRAKCRVYADGLSKYEPSDLAGILLPKLRRPARARATYELAVGELLKGNVDEAQVIADRFFV